MYRTKVGKYGIMFRKKPDADKDKKDDKKGGNDSDKKPSSVRKMGGNNPRRAFSNALDSIWAELSNSGEWSRPFCTESCPTRFYSPSHSNHFPLSPISSRFAQMSKTAPSERQSKSETRVRSRTSTGESAPIAKSKTTI